MEFNCVKLHFSIEICNANLHFSEKYLFEERAGDGGGVLGELLGSALGDDEAAAATTVGTEVEEVVHTLENIQIVLDDDHRVALIDKLLQNVEQYLDVFEVKAGRRLVKDVQRVAGRLSEQLRRQFHSLTLAAGKCHG